MERPSLDRNRMFDITFDDDTVKSDLENIISWQNFWQESDRAFLAFSLLSAIASVLVIVVYWGLPHVRRTPGQFVVQATVCDLCLCLCFIGIYFCPKQGSDFHHFRNYLWLLLLSAITLEVAANVYRTLMYSNLITIYRNPFRPERHHPLYTFVGWVSAVFAVVFFSKEFGTSECQHCFHALSFGLVLVPSLIFLCGFGMYVFVRLLLRAGETRQKSLSPSRRDEHASIFQANLAQQRVSRHGLAYLCLFGLQHLIGLGFTNFLLWHPSLSALILFSWFICLRPFISCIGWFAINDVVFNLFGVCSCTRRNASKHEVEAHEQHIALAELGAIGPPSISSTQEVGTLRPRPWNTSSKGMEDGFKEELRFELLFDVAREIGNSANDDLVGTACIPAFRRNDKPQTPLITGSWHSHSPSRPYDGPYDDAEDVSMRGVGLLSLPSSENLTRVLSRNFTGLAGVEHHYKQEFKAIRGAFGVDARVYALDFPNNFSENSEYQEWQKKLKESVSEGKSGTFFYRVMSNDKKSICASNFIVKQVTTAEKDTLIKILPAYKEYVVLNQGKSLIQYFGCHSVPLRWKFSGSVHFVVMKNFLPVKPWLVFDLKGATANRRALKEKLLHAHTGADRKGADDYGTLRDWEWMDIAMYADLSQEHTDELEGMVARDAEFLKSQNLLDYSLLVGIHRFSDDVSDSDRDEKLRQLTEAGGYPSVDRQKVYFFGIIDVLERYSWRWQMQHIVLRGAYRLSCRDGVDGISAMPPAQYADRFFTFVQQEVLRNWKGKDEGDRDENCCWRCICWPACCGKRRLGQLGGKDGGERWGQLWLRRRRGLVRERIEVERKDYLRRLSELQHTVELLKQGVPGCNEFLQRNLAANQTVAPAG